MAKYLLAVDGGGTKTEAIACREDGTILSRVLRGPSNPNDIGVEASIALLVSITKELLSVTGEGEHVLFVGIAGAGNHGARLLDGISAKFPDLQVKVGTDAVNLISGGIPFGDGAAVIAGTGSVCYVRRGEELLRIGGWGYLLDSAGSGYDIGRDAIARALMEIDGRRPPSSVGRIVEKFLGKPADLALTEIYAQGKPFIASLAGPILEAAEKGDAECYEIAEASIRAWGEMLDRAYTLLGKPFRAVLGGGIFSHCPWLVIDLSMNTSAPVELFATDTPMVYGAMIEAAKMIGVAGIGEKSMKNAFQRSYHELTGEGELPHDDHDEE